MKWEELTSVDFEEALKKTNVCILALGVLENIAEYSFELLT